MSVLIRLLLSSSEIPFGPMLVLYEQKKFFGQMCESSSDCIVSTVVHGLAMLWKELIWFQARYQGNKIDFDSTLQSCFRGSLELHFPPEFLTSAAANFVIYSHFISVGMHVKSGDDSALTTQFGR
jgi:hypothetical protein